MKKGIYVLAMSALLFACGSGNDSGPIKTNIASTNSEGNKIENPNVTISGVIKDAPNKKVVLAFNSQNESKQICQTKTNDKGQFVLKGAIDEMGLYELQLDSSRTSQGMDKKIPLTLMIGDKVTVHLVNNDDFSFSAQYDGTKWAAPLNEYMKQMQKFISWQKTLTPQQIHDRKNVMKLVIQHKKIMDENMIKEIEKDPSNPANILLMTNLMPMMGYKYYDIDYLNTLKKIEVAYQKAYPKATVTKALSKQIPQIEQEYKSFQSYQVDQIAPDIALPNPQGDTMRLSNLRGKYVLIDFWASWCGPCRRENPNVVKAYKKYHNDGFEIFSVSLDNDKSAWEEAIKKDGLIWDNQVSELKKWNSQVAEEYGVKSIPHSVLINPKGKIIAENLRGPSLDEKLAKLFKH